DFGRSKTPAAKRPVAGEQKRSHVTSPSVKLTNFFIVGTPLATVACMHDFCSSRSGVAALEYAMIARLIALALLAIAPQIGAAFDGALGVLHVGETHAAAGDPIHR